MDVLSDAPSSRGSSIGFSDAIKARGRFVDLSDADVVSAGADAAVDKLSDCSRSKKPIDVARDPLERSQDMFGHIVP